MDLEGRVALVTGGGRRLGRAITEALAEAGCRVVIHYGQSRREAEETAAALRSRGTEAFCVGADLRSQNEVVALFRTVEERVGYLDVLVNSAATFEKRALVETSDEDWERVMAVNLRAPFLCLRLGAPLLLASTERGRSPAAVVNIGDLSGVFPWPGYSLHGASKAGLLHMTRVTAREMAPRIRVNAVVPGPILPPPGADAQDEAWQDLVQRIPAARPGSPREVGASVVFLASNDFVTGETLCVDGGEHLLGAAQRSL